MTTSQHSLVVQDPQKWNPGYVQPKNWNPQSDNVKLTDWLYGRCVNIFDYHQTTAFEWVLRECNGKQRRDICDKNAGCFCTKENGAGCNTAGDKTEVNCQ